MPRNRAESVADRLLIGQRVSGVKLSRYNCLIAGRNLLTVSSAHCAFTILRIVEPNHVPPYRVTTLSAFNFSAIAS